MAMDNVRASNMRKYILAKMYPEFVAMAIIAQIHIDGIDQCRIHAAGDFFSNDYVDMWRAIIIMCPDVTFWTYTKVDYALKAFDDLENITITPSMLPDNMGYNFGTCGELLDKYHTLTAAGYRVHICACGTPFQKHCAECTCGCKAVGKDCDYVFFIKHSTPDYKAGKNDPVEYAAICEIIAKQNN